MGEGTAFPTSTGFLPNYIRDAEIFQQKMAHSKTHGNEERLN